MNEGLSPRQFSFRKGKSTIEAMKEVISCLEKGTRKRNNRGFCILIILDVRNAFNSGRWPKIIETMDEMGTCEYLIEATKNYITDRNVLIGQNSTLEMTCGVPKGYKMALLLWNIMYHGIFNINMLEGATVVSFTNDIGIVVTVWTKK